MTKSVLGYYLVFFLIFLTALQFSAWGIEEGPYGVIRSMIMGTVGLIFLATLRNPVLTLKKYPEVGFHFWAWLIFSFLIVILYLAGVKVGLGQSRDLLLILVIVIISLNINMTEKRLKRLINLFLILFTGSALSLVYKYASGFEIHEFYLPLPKNQVAPAFAVAFVIGVYQGFRERGKRKWVFFTLSVFLFLSLLVIRSRANILAIFFATTIFIFFYLKRNKYSFIFAILGVLAVIFLGYDLIYDALFLRHDASDIQSVSSGRWDTYVDGISVFKEYPLFGLLESNTSIQGTIHNYILINIVTYGLLLSLPILLIYFNYAGLIFKGIKQNTFNLFDIGPLVLLVLFIISLFEYTYPYSPGSATFFPFFLFGQYLKFKKTNNPTKTKLN